MAGLLLSTMWAGDIDRWLRALRSQRLVTAGLRVLDFKNVV